MVKGRYMAAVMRMGDSEQMITLPQNTWEIVTTDLELLYLRLHSLNEVDSVSYRKQDAHTCPQLYIV